MVSRRGTARTTIPGVGEGMGQGDESYSGHGTMTEPMIRRRTPIKLAAMILLPVAILAGATYVTVRAKPPPVDT